jgi:hypothetical protein
LSHNTAYKYQIIARGTDKDGAAIQSGWSSPLVANTGNPESRKSGSLTYSAEPLAKGTWRSPDGWSYNGDTVVQGFYSNADYNAYGVITYNGQAFRNWVTTNYGADVLANLRWVETKIWVSRLSGGTGNAVTTYWWVTPTIAKQGGRPSLAGNEASSALTPGQSGWVVLASPWWGSHVLMNDPSPFGAHYSSFALHRGNSSEYAKFNVGGVQATCSWDFVTVAYVAPRWS